MGKQDWRLSPSLASTPMLMGICLQQDIPYSPYISGSSMLTPPHKLTFVAFYTVTETTSGQNFYQ